MANELSDYIAITTLIKRWDLNLINEQQLILSKTIASGGQGKVKIGQYYNMHVIVKILHKLNPKNFTTEVLNAYKYRHPNIPKFLGVFESNKSYGIVIEHVDGVTMTKLIQLEKQGKVSLSLIQKLDYLIQLASVIEFLHSHALMHRDLKTDNIMIDHLGSLKLLDFGIALPGIEKWINMESPEYSLTPNYMAPEIALQAQDEGEEEEEEEEEGEDEEEESEEDEDDEEEDNEEGQDKVQQPEVKLGEYNNNNINNNPKAQMAQTQKNDKLSETYNRRMSMNQERTKTLFRQLTQTEEYKSCSWKAGKWILITNKYDIWTFGIIMAQLFTRCRPWCRNERENVSEMECQTRLVCQLPYPIHSLHPQNECELYEAKIKDIMRRCLTYDPDQRASIQETKRSLTEIFDMEVKDKMRLEKIMAMQKDNKENQKINSILKTLDENQKKDVIRNNKILIRKEVNIEAINKLNQMVNSNKKINEKSMGNSNNLSASTSTGTINPQMQLLINRINRRTGVGENAISNTMLDILRKANIANAQKAKVNEHRIFELKEAIKDIEEAN